MKKANDSENIYGLSSSDKDLIGELELFVRVYQRNPLSKEASDTLLATCEIQKDISQKKETRFWQLPEMDACYLLTDIDNRIKTILRSEI